MSASTIRVPVNAKLQYGAAGSQAATVVSTVGKVTVGTKRSTTKVPSRLADVVFYGVGLMDFDVSFSIADDSSDANLADMIAAYLGRAPRAFWIRDAATGSGPDMDFIVDGMKRNEDEEQGAIIYEFTIKPAAGGRCVPWS